MVKDKTEFGADRHVSVSAKAFTAAMLAVSTEETRYYLQGVLVEPCSAGGVNVVATNGHIIIAIHDKDGETNGKWICPVPAHMRRFLLANLESRDAETYAHDDDDFPAEGDDKRPLDRIKFDGKIASITAPEHAWREKSPLEMVMATTAPAIDGTFPDWTRVLPNPTDKTPPLPTFTIATHYAMAVNRAVCIWKGNASTGIRVRGVEKHGPILMGAHGDPDFIVALMPMRDDAEILVLPSWISVTKQPAEGIA